MNTILTIILTSFLSGVMGTAIGGLIGALIKKESSKTVSLLLAFASGVMISVVFFELIPDSFFPETSNKEMPLLFVVFGVVLGYVTVYFLNVLIDNNTNPEVQHIDPNHPKTADDLDELIHADHYNMHIKKEDKNRNRELMIAGIVMSAAIALHNLPEGMVVGASYAIDSSNLASKTGLMIAMVIGLHNIPEGMSVSVPLIAGGMKPAKAVLITALSAAPEMIGALLGYLLGTINPTWLSLCLSFAGGAMLYVVFGELLPESFLMWKSKAPATFAMIGVIIGLILVKI